MAEEKAGSKKIPWKGARPLLARLWPYLRPHNRLAAFIGLIAALGAVPAFVSPLLVRQIFDVHMENKDVDGLLRVGFILLGLTVAAVALAYARSLLTITLHNRVQFRLTADVFAQVLRLPLRYFDKSKSGEIMSRVRDDVAATHTLFSDSFINGLLDIVKAVGFFVMCLVVDIGLSMAGLVLVAVIFVVTLTVMRPLRKRTQAAREADADCSGALHETLAGLRTIRTTDQEPAERHRFLRTYKGALRSAARRDVLQTILGNSLRLTFSMGSYLIVAVGAYRILRGESSIGDLFAFFMYLTNFGGAASAVAGLLPSFQRGLVSLDRLTEILDHRVEVEPEAVQPPPARVLGEVLFNQITFEYDEDLPVLTGVHLHVKAGETIALVGRSGSGKTTLMHLLPRLYDPKSGEISLDGRPLSSLPLRWLRQRIGVVPQDVFLFNRTIRENIAYATPSASEEQIMAAARFANADRFIRELPKGYDTAVGERGVRLSGGEKQRLAIAREFLRDPPILILDEATANLDAESEGLIREAVDRLMAGRTSFVIAHRLSTIQGADRIVVLDRGRIVELGTHGELLAKKGLYSELHKLQMLETPDESGPLPVAETEDRRS